MDIRLTKAPNYDISSTKNFNKAGVQFGKSLSNVPTKILKPKNAFKAIALSVIALLSATCSNIKGGNFIYNEANERIERFDLNDTEICTGNKYNLHSCYDKEHIKSYGVDRWIEANKDKLCGSCMFERDKSAMSKMIVAFTRGNNCDNKYIPSHSAPIYNDEGVLKMLQIKAPKISAIDFADYLKYTNDDYLIFLRDFDIDNENFSKNVKQNIGKPYGYISAGQTISSKINIDGGLHCSEGYVKEIQKEGVLSKVDANSITPHTLLHLLANNHFNHKNNDLGTF